MRDFTPDMYKSLLDALSAAKYRFVAVEDYCAGVRYEKTVILRHDIDANPGRALVIAEMEKGMDVRSTFYIRYALAVKNPDVVRGIVALGHEVGYHYEEMSVAKGNVGRAAVLFEKRLDFLRCFYDVKTIAMHGSPLSAYDNRNLWKSIDYRQFGVTAEAYLDIDYSDCLYLTDTGRCWNGVSRRDKVVSKFGEIYDFHHTGDIISALERGNMPDRLAITTHPQRWLPMGAVWVWELCSQKLKNMVKSVCFGF